MELRVLNNIPLHPADVIGEVSPNEFRGIKATFVNMPLRESAKPNFTPEGPLILAAILRQYGADVSLVDLNVYRVNDEETQRAELTNGRQLTFAEAEALLERHFAKHGEQDIVAFSGLITTLRWQDEMARSVRRMHPNCFMVTGTFLST